ncbi:uncharacterized protein LOC129005088 [Macrosteles quadrilineatus]|uniref:uncharacterized protein LOC129005088 n=1 Tax=Macrosteles quadrilineatus TaxID=74068 RepID=UPI0023E2F5B0|nr:uncharacterized protein LOC129005088 [Macrosteles quadrilineatus]
MAGNSCSKCCACTRASPLRCRHSSQVAVLFDLPTVRLTGAAAWFASHRPCAVMDPFTIFSSDPAARRTLSSVCTARASASAPSAGRAAGRRAPGGSALPALSGREGIKQLTHALSFGGADQLTEPTDLAQLRPIQWARPVAGTSSSGQELPLLSTTSHTSLHYTGPSCSSTPYASYSVQHTRTSEQSKPMDQSPKKRRFFFIFDAPHLFKSIRNALLKTNIQHGDGVWAKWDHFVTLYNLDSKSDKARSLCKITEKHVAPNAFDRMKVKLATQVFSHSVTAAMQTAVGTGQLPADAVNTATFIGRLNDIFDCLNSKVQFDANPLKCAISSTDAGLRVGETLKNALPWIQTWRCDKKTSRSLSRPPCFSGLYQTVSSVLQLWNDIKEEDTKYLLTNRLTQDALENEFGIARQRCGYEKNPSAMQFRQNLRHRIQVTLMKPPESANCEIDDDVILTASDLDKISDTEDEEGDGDGDGEDQVRNVDVSMSTTEGSGLEDMEVDDPDDIVQSDDSDIDLDAEHIQPPQIAPDQQPTLESCSVQYVAGYLAKICLKKFSCEECSRELTTGAQLSDENELLILHRSYSTKDGTSHLTAPSKEMASRQLLPVHVHCIRFVETARPVRERPVAVGSDGE